MKWAEKQEVTEASRFANVITDAIETPRLES